MDIVLDFDGTCVAHAFPHIGPEIGAPPVLKELIATGHRIILFTMRSDIEDPKSHREDIVPIGGMYLTDALGWFERHKISLYGVQHNPDQLSWTHSPKAYGQLIIDDAALGCPLRFDKSISNRPFVDWPVVRQLLIESNIL